MVRFSAHVAASQNRESGQGADAVVVERYSEMAEWSLARKGEGEVARGGGPWE